VTAAKDSALRYSLTNTQFIAGDAEEAIKQVDKIDIATLNPPRKGCSNAFLETLIAASPKQILYISCNPTSLMRDLDYLVTRGYQLKSMQPFDMFPETMHVETVAHLIRA
jgi:SAM-dependent methyltransferases related to tRNA (uracil-5-)-methyltransferase